MYRKTPMRIVRWFKKDFDLKEFSEVKKEHRTRYKGVPTDKQKGLIPMATEPKHFLSKSAVGRSDR